jgi:hypothetical protein
VSSDTTDRTTRQPNVSEELDERLSRTTTPHVRVLADEFALKDRRRVLLNKTKIVDERDTLREAKSNSASASTGRRHA